MSLLNLIALENNALMSVTDDTSHEPIGPCSPLAQSPTGDSVKQAPTAVLSSDLSFGLNTAVVGGGASGWDWVVNSWDSLGIPALGVLNLD